MLSLAIDELYVNLRFYFIMWPYHIGDKTEMSLLLLLLSILSISRSDAILKILKLMIFGGGGYFIIACI